MITDLFFSFAILVFFAYGLTRPHIALAGVIWTDTISPQLLSYSFLAGKPLSLLVTLFFFMTVVLNMSKVSAPKQKAPLVFLLLFMIWMSLSTLGAHHPYAAMFKYQLVIKILFLSAFIPFVIRTRLQLETFLWIFQVSVGFFLQVAGLKTIFGGGGYNVDVIQSANENSGITETSSLALMAALSIPLMVYLYRYSLLGLSNRWVRYYILLTAVCAVFTVLGTFARTGLIAGAFVGLMFFLVSQKRIRFVFLGAACLLLLLPLLPEGWTERMSTIKTANQEQSALGRIVVWRWTLDYAADNPFFGGGFFAYLDNVGQLQNYTGDTEVFEKNERAKAFHNIFFEVLGEHGYVGLLLYLGIVYTSLRRYWSLRNTYAGSYVDNYDWLPYLSLMLLIAIMTYFVGGMFVAIAYNPWLYYLLFMGVSLVNVVSNESRKIQR